MRIFYLPSSHAQQRQFEKESYNCYPVRLAMECEKHRQMGDEVCWNNPSFAWKNWDNYKWIREPEGLPFLSLPHPDRVFTRAKEYTSGNYKYLPGTHILSGSGCWYGRCSFCVENSSDIMLTFSPVTSSIGQVRSP